MKVIKSEELVVFPETGKLNLFFSFLTKQTNKQLTPRSFLK